jgi:lipoprotein-releasing system permease protein
VQTLFERFVALRYLKGAEGRGEGRSFLQFITYVAIGGVALGVAALLLSLAIVRGFSQEIQSKIVGIGAHVQVRSYVQDAPLNRADSMAADLTAYPEVTRVMPVVEDFVLLRRSQEAIDGVALVGVDAPPPYLEGRLVAGEFDLREGTENRPGLVVGQSLAERLGVEVGDAVTAFSMRSRGEGGGLQDLGRPRIRQFVVRGVYETSLTNVDDLYVFTGIATARRLTGVPQTAVSRFDLTLRDVAAVDSVASRIEDQFGFPVAARTIYQQFSGLFAWVNLQESIIPLVIGVIILVAAFNIIGILLMMILEKTSEIGTLQSLGASGRTVKRLFLVLGLLIGALGTSIGMALALSLSWIQQTFQVIPLPAEAYYMTHAPIQINPLDYLLVGTVALLLCGLAAYVPARVAARIEPVRAIRFQ